MQDADRSAIAPRANHLTAPLTANPPDKSTAEYIPDN
jgi:hypothetical protein